MSPFRHLQNPKAWKEKINSSLFLGAESLSISKSCQSSAWPKSSFRFSVPSYGKTWMNFLANPNLNEYVSTLVCNDHIPRPYHLILSASAFICSLFVLFAPTLSCVWLFVTPWTVAHQTPLSMGFPRQEYWSGLLFPPPGDLPDPRIKPTLFCISCTGRQVFYQVNHQWSPILFSTRSQIF